MFASNLVKSQSTALSAISTQNVTSTAIFRPPELGSCKDLGTLGLYCLDSYCLDERGATVLPYRHLDKDTVVV